MVNFMLYNILNTYLKSLCILLTINTLNNIYTAMQLKVNTKELRCWNAVVSVSFYLLLNNYLISASGNVFRVVIY